MNTTIFDDYDEQSQEMLKGLNFLSFNDVNRGITTEDPFKNIRTTKTAREISNEIAMESPFGKRSAFYKPLVVAQTINTLETFKVTIRIMVDEDLGLVRDKYKTETVEDYTIKLYIAVKDETLVDKQHQTDLRHAGIRLSNITEISGVVLGDKIFTLFNNYPKKMDNYITKIAQDLIDADAQLEPLMALLKEKFDYYMAHKRSTLFPLGLVGQLIQQELKKDLQEFWKPVLTSIAKEIRTLKMDDEKYWQPYTPDGKLKHTNKFTPLVGKGLNNAEAYIQNFLQPFDQIDKLLQNYLNLSKIEADNKFTNQAHNTKLKKALAQIYSLFKDIFNYFKSGLLNFIATSVDKVYQLNAFLVGVINGVIEFVASLFDLVGFLSGLLSGDAVMLWQAVKKEFETLKEKGAFTYLFKALGKFFDTVSKRYDTSQDKYIVLKHLGEDVISIVEVVLGAIAVFKAGKVIVSNSKTTFDSFKKTVDDIFEKRNKEFEELSPDNVKGKGLYGGKVLSKKDIENWEKQLLKKYGTKLKKIDSFDKPDIQAQFDPNTNTIKYKDDVTEYIMSHESFHAEEMSEIGFDEYVKGAHIVDTPWTIENRITQYKREKYVYERLQENISKFNKEEGLHSFLYFDTIKAKLEILLKSNNIPFPN